MGKRKIAQRNTLAQWAGHKATSGQNGVLIFRIEASKLKLCQGQAGPVEADQELPIQAATSDDEIASDQLLRTNHVRRGTTESNVSRSTQRTTVDCPPTKPVHPFFHKKKSLEYAVEIQVKRDENPVEKQVLDSAEVPEFFKPRSTQVSQTNLAPDVNDWSKRARPAPMPAKNEILVCSIDSGLSKPSPVSRDRQRRLDKACSTDDNWQTSEWWLTMKTRMRNVQHVSKEIVDQTRRSAQSSTERHLGHVVCRKQDPAHDSSQLWTSKYAPQTAAEFLSQTGDAQIVKQWLQSRQTSSKDRLQLLDKNGHYVHNKYMDEQDDFIVDDDLVPPLTSDIGAPFGMDNTPHPHAYETLFRSNVLILCGPHGCGKSALVSAITTELEFEVFEVNPTDRRSARDVIDMVGEASNTHVVNKQTSTTGQRTRSILLFEEVDVLFRDDKDFWQAVIALIVKSRRPLILTCTNVDSIPQQISDPRICIHITKPTPPLLTGYLHTILHKEGRIFDAHELSRLIEQCDLDLRSCIMNVQLITQSKQESTSQRSRELERACFERDLAIPSLYQYHLPATRRCSRAQILQYASYSQDLSYLDVIATQQRSTYLEASCIYENDDEDNPARAAHKDDLTGHPILSDPQGKYTRLHPGDLSIASELALMLDDQFTHQLINTFSMWYLPLKDLKADDSINDASEVSWKSMLFAAEPFAVPENWMLEYTPHNSIDRPRGSGILSTSILPYLRQIVRIEDYRTAWERDHVQGRQTRNTLSSEFGAMFARPSKIPISLRGAISETGLREYGYL